MGSTQLGQNAPQGDDGKVINLPAREFTNAQQLQMLLGVAGSTMSIFGSLLHCPEEMQERADKFGGEVRIAAENACIEALTRIQEMLTDKSRWDGSFQKSIEDAFNRAHQKQMEVLDAQQEAAEEVLAPHFRYKPALARMKDGVWLAFLGNVDDLDNAICGLGATPADAVNEFDKAFYGFIDPAIAQWLKLREAFLEAGSKGTPPPFPQSKNNEQPNSQLDPNGHISSEQTPCPEQELGGDSQNFGEEQNGLPS